MTLKIQSMIYSTCGMGGDENNRAFQEAILAPVDLIIMQWNQFELDFDTIKHGVLLKVNMK